MRLNAMEAETGFYGQAKTASIDFDKSQQTMDRKNGKTPPSSTDGNNTLFIQNIQKYPENGQPNPRNEDWKDTYRKGLTADRVKRAHFNQPKQLETPVHNPSEKAGGSCLKATGHNIQKSTPIPPMHSLNDQNPFGRTQNNQKSEWNQKATKQSRVHIFEKEQDGSEGRQPNLNGVSDQSQVGRPKSYISISRKSRKVSDGGSQSSEQQLFKLPPRSPSTKQKSEDSFQFKIPAAGLKIQSKESKYSVDVDSEQQNFNLYDHNSIQKSKVGSYKVKSNVNQKADYNMLPLEKILQTSCIYKDYLNRGNPNKKPSLYTELGLVDTQKLPHQFFFKPERVFFNKMKEDLPYEYNYNGYHIIGKVNSDRTKFFFQDLKLQQLGNMKGLKCTEINFKKQLEMNKNVEYDYQNKRFYIFSNKEQKIFVYSQTSQELLCQITVKKRVFDPQLFIHYISNRIFLMVIGGYTKVERNVVQGSKHIEIFEIRKWEVELQSQVINLSIGRISPIIMIATQKNQRKILILGGNSIAKVDERNNLNFTYEKEINQSTNLSGTSIPSQQIIQLFDYEQPAITFLHPVKTSYPAILHDGCVIPVKNTCLLLLPGCRRLMQVKFMNKEINLIEGKHYNYIPLMGKLQRRQIYLQLNQEGIVIFKISEQGIFQMIAPQDKTPSTCCILY